MSNNLGAPTLTTTQTGKETTINDAVGQLDSAITAELEITCSTGTEDYAITTANLQLYSHYVFIASGTPPTATDKIDMILSTAVIRWYTVRNELAAPVHLYIGTDHYGMVMPGETRIFYCDGTDLFPYYGSKDRDPVRVVSTTNITTSTALNSGDTIDGITLADGDRVLVMGQSTGSENGVYNVASTPYKSGEPYNIGAKWQVLEGTFANKTFKCTATTPTFELAYYPFDMAGYVQGAPTVSVDLLVFNVTRAFKLPASLTGSLATMGTAPSGGAPAITVAQNGTSKGTINFADAATTATFTFTTETTWAVGDTLEIQAPSNFFSAADFAFTLKGQLAV